MSIYEARTYRDVLTQKIRTFCHVRGYRTKLAKAAGFSPSFLSQVMNESVELTPEHAIRLARYWELDETATEYFMLLVDHDRAGSIILREHLHKKLEAMRAQLFGHQPAVRHAVHS